MDEEAEYPVISRNPEAKWRVQKVFLRFSPGFKHTDIKNDGRS